MENQIALQPPAAADYRALLDRANSALSAFASGAIDRPTLRLQLLEIEEDARTLDALGRLHRKAAQLAPQSRNRP